MTRCSKCQIKIRQRVLYDPLGAPVCGACHDKVSGLVLGMLEDSFGLGVLLAGTHTKGERSNGMLQWIRDSLNPRRRKPATDLPKTPDQQPAERAE